MELLEEKLRSCSGDGLRTAASHAPRTEQTRFKFSSGEKPKIPPQKLLGSIYSAPGVSVLPTEPTEHRCKTRNQETHICASSTELPTPLKPKPTPTVESGISAISTYKCAYDVWEPLKDLLRFPYRDIFGQSPRRVWGSPDVGMRNAGFKLWTLTNKIPFPVTLG